VASTARSVAPLRVDDDPATEIDLAAWRWDVRLRAAGRSRRMPMPPLRPLRILALVIVLLLQVFPEALIATPIFIIFKAMGLLNSFVAVILATTSKTLAFALVILRPMFLQVPHELEEASFVDGATRFQAFWRIVLPMMRTPLLVVGAICFAQAYGQFVYPITLLTQQELQPGSVGIYAFIGAELSDWHRVMAFASIYVLPILALFLLLQRNIVAGLTGGALK